MKGTAAFAAAAIIQRTVGLLLLPFFTRVLTPSEYGQIGVITTLVAAFATVASLGLETAVFRGYVQAAGDRLAARTFVNTVGGFAIMVPLSVAALAAVVLSWFPPIFDIPLDALRLAFVGAAATASSTVVPLAVLRAQERFSAYLRLMGIQVVLTTTLTILFVAVLRWGVTGWMLANALGSVLLLARGLAILRHRWTFDIDLEPLRRALAFGLPLVPHALAHWGLALSDRAILGIFVPTAVIGAYYVAYQACIPITVIAIALSQATQPMYAEAATSPARRHELARVATVQTVLTALVAAAVALVGPPLIRLLLPPSYGPAADFLPWLALGSAFFGIYLIPMNAIAVMAGRTERVWMVTVFAAALNVALNIVLVPQIGATAAAINTAVGYGALLVGGYLYMRSVCDPPIPYERNRIIIGVALIVTASLLAAVLTPPDPIAALAVRLAALIGVVIVLVRGLFVREATSIYQAIRLGLSGTAQ